MQQVWDIIGDEIDQRITNAMNPLDADNADNADNADDADNADNADNAEDVVTCTPKSELDTWQQYCDHP